ncbi:MAG: DUF4307 domain-containing protein [Mycobacteriaceae bacterium]|nr:DUF4307 domain-containing protein [Mycobacteriaceae bacterium]
MSDRYGAPPRRWSGRPVAMALGALVVLAGLGVAWIGYRALGTKPIEGQTIATRLVDDKTMSVTFTVTRKDPSQPVNCVVRVTGKHGATVGTTEVPVPGSDSATVKLDATVHGVEPPVAGELFSCEQTGPSGTKP